MRIVHTGTKIKGRAGIMLALFLCICSKINESYIKASNYFEEALGLYIFMIIFWNFQKLSVFEIPLH